MTQLPDASIDSGDTAESNGGDDRRRGGWFKKLSFALITLVIGALLPTIISHIDHALNPPKPRIEVDSIRVADANLGKPARVQVLLRNIGNQLAIIKGAQLQIQQFTNLPICLSQGALGSSATYGKDLPVDPKPGTRVEIPIHQQEAPGSADNFTLNLHLPKDAPQGSTRVYFINVALQYDNTAQLVEAGHLLVSLPLTPDYRFVWTKSSLQIFSNPVTEKTFGSEYPLLSHCLIANSKALVRMLRLHGNGSSTLDALRSRLSACCVQEAPTKQVEVVLRADCRKQKAVIRPNRFFFDCDKATGTEYLDKMSWSQWGTSRAIGTGIEFVNNCDGNCPVGKFESYPVVVRLSQPVSNNIPQQDRWQKVELTYPDKGPLGLPDFSYDYLSP